MIRSPVPLARRHGHCLAYELRNTEAGDRETTILLFISLSPYFKPIWENSLSRAVKERVLCTHSESE